MAAWSRDSAIASAVLSDRPTRLLKAVSLCEAMKHSDIKLWLARLLLTTLLSSVLAYGQRYESAPRQDAGMKPASNPASCRGADSYRCPYASTLLRSVV